MKKTYRSGRAGILFAGDVHGRFDHIDRIVRDLGPQALVLLGDIEAPRPLAALVAPWEVCGTEVWFIPGNHDTDSEERWRHLDSLAERNLDGRVAMVAGVRIAGLGGIFRETIWDPARPAHAPSYAAYAAQLARRTDPSHDLSAADRGRLLKHRSSIFPAVYDGLVAEHADTLVTHEAPSCHPYGFRAIDELAQALGVAQLFHGHHHDCQDYRDSDVRLGFQAYGVGLRGVTDGRGQILRAGERDHDRRRSSP